VDKGRQPVDVVGMHVRDKDGIDIGRIQIQALDLLDDTPGTVDKNEASLLPDQKGRVVSFAGSNPAAGPQKTYQRPL
jgi:hypothetical protein